MPDDNRNRDREHGDPDQQRSGQRNAAQGQFTLPRGGWPLANRAELAKATRARLDDLRGGTPVENAETLRRVLAARGVPVLGDAHRVPVRDEPSARPLLHLLGICVELARGQLESVPAADVVDLLASPLVAADTVNTMPGKTMDAFADHGWVNTESIIGLAAESQEIFDKLVAVGVDLTGVFLVLENEGVSKFEDAWNDLLSATAEQLSAANKG